MAASEGIGYGSAQALARWGAEVAICARRAGPLAKAARDLERVSDGRVLHRVCDVSRPDASARFIEWAAKELGGLEVLVNNGGGPSPGGAASFSDADWSSAFELLVMSNLRASRAAYPFLKRRGGSIVNIVSTSVKQPQEQLVLSNSLRASVVGLAKTLSVEWGPAGIRVNNVCPGSISTKRIREVYAAQARAAGVSLAEMTRRREAAIPLGRLGTIEEIGETVAFLASPLASYITGQTLSVDGGSTRFVFG